MTQSHPAGRCVSFTFQPPWPNGPPEQFVPYPLTRSLRRSSLGVTLPAPPCRLLCLPQSWTLVAASRLDLLWLVNQPIVVGFIPRAIQVHLPQLVRSMSELCLIYKTDLNQV
jgi:hypothetical protein